MTDLVDRIDGLLHEPTQVRDDGAVDLTVSSVSRIAEAGRVDFGGGELEPARTEPVATTVRNPDDDYGWWHLDAGHYLIEYNESLAGSEPVRVQPRSAVRERGAFHPSLEVAELGSMPFVVGGSGLRLKENARVSIAASRE